MDNTTISYDLQREVVKVVKKDDLEEFIKLKESFVPINFCFSPGIFTGKPILCSATPLVCVAAFYGANKIINYLILNNCNLDQKDQLGCPISHFAVYGGCIQTIELLSENGVKFETDSLFVAADIGDFNTFMYIYATQNANLLLRKEDGSCLLHHAVKGKSWELISFITEEVGMDLDINDLLGAIQMIRTSEDFFNEEEEEESEEEEDSEKE